MKYFLTLLLVLTFASLTHAQDAPKQVSEETRLLLKNIQLERELLEARYKLTQADIQVLQDRLEEMRASFNELNAQFEKALDKAFKNLGLDRTKFTINIDTGTIAPAKAVEEKK